MPFARGSAVARGRVVARGGAATGGPGTAGRPAIASGRHKPRRAAFAVPVQQVDPGRSPGAGEGVGGLPLAQRVEVLHRDRQRQTSDTFAGPGGADRVNLLNWDGKGSAARLMPPRRDGGEPGEHPEPRGDGGDP